MVECISPSGSIQVFLKPKRDDKCYLKSLIATCKSMQMENHLILRTAKEKELVVCIQKSDTVSFERDENIV